MFPYLIWGMLCLGLTPSVSNRHTESANTSTCHHVCKSDIKRGKDNIYWSIDRKLVWSDYQGIADYSHKELSAITSSGIVSSKGCKDGKIDYEIHALFEKDQSWVKPEAYTTYHLKHEQGHFDITEVYARLLEIQLKEHSFVCGEEQEFEEFISEFLEMWEATQRRYDDETHNSMKPDEQGVWLERIDGWLIKIPTQKQTRQS